ncbi:competence protein ComK [Heyndrickxia sporothermodurans]|uniref:Competence protein ComK n=1 Tax=Heyndrickxia sporothermodurans TaxID=46224 RepID=A0A150KMX5_9BACI|nr:competence protein ComK [Heyndrickxia sporothermodurans]KYC89947.1 hypothetical protein B4102_3954 [Heyndrickxia sporothermodurans]MBL5782255.1 competence protein ComK [Heyndrickxia sporothermodurans]MBL5794094.1 competence protein ComK [Heyndrickxia sporothermodurans]MBL5855106.1 competence protein ComK [Heyndrickxia sporothermodurans]MBL5866717.1 competence protein ComK [Heyndrickxia sporothermodurans]
MKEVKMYIINNRTCIIYPYFDQYGNLFAIVIETEGVYLVNLSPMEIVEHSLLNYGSSYQGAKEGARHLLGNTTMNPLMISEKLGIYAIPTMSPSSKECVWFMLGQYKKHLPIEKNIVNVLFKNGYETKLSISQKSFENKLQKAFRLREHMEEMGKQEFEYTAFSGYSVVVDPNTNGYIFREYN